MSTEKGLGKVVRVPGLWVLTVVSALVLAVLVASLMAHPAALRWEYRVFAVADYSSEQALEALGDSGWEIVAARRIVMSGGTNGYEYTLKRPNNWAFQLRTYGRPKADRDREWDATLERIEEAVKSAGSW